MKNQVASKDVAYKIITDQIVAMLNEGTIPWEKPWFASEHRNLKTGHVYRGVNRFVTGFSKFSKPYWLTFNQVSELGGTVKKGSKATYIVFWKFIEKKETDGTKKVIPFCRYYKIFNVEQTEGLDHLIPEEAVNEWDADEAAEAIISNCRFANIINYDGGSSAYYTPMRDSIHLPERETFKSAAGFYSTAYHEMAHATGHITRLNRNLLAGHFGNHEYSREELVAELTAAYLSAKAGVQNEKELANKAAYIQSWLKALKNDVHMIVWAAGRAEKAAAYILREDVDDDEQLGIDE